jgi:hypothetical protein
LSARPKRRRSYSMSKVANKAGINAASSLVLHRDMSIGSRSRSVQSSTCRSCFVCNTAVSISGLFMAVLVLDCPHCSAENTSFQVRWSYEVLPHRGETALLASCGRCQMPVSAVIRVDVRAGGTKPHEINGDLFMADSPYRLLDSYPKVPPIDIPLNRPPAVESVYSQAVRARRAELWDAACGMYRRSMELALKEIEPGIAAWKLEKRIDQLAGANKITPDLQTWAHELRLDGNEGLHGTEPATKDLCDQMDGFCRFLLLYLYTLPAQVTDARARRAAV